MGEPIRMVKGDEEKLVYGAAYMALLIKDGWQIADMMKVTPEPTAKVEMTNPKRRGRPAKAK